jgi:hypothetical protein
MLDDREFDETLELLPPPPGMITNGAFRARRGPCHRMPSLSRSTETRGGGIKPVKTVNPVNSVGAPSRSSEVVAAHRRYESRRENLVVFPGTQVVSDDDSYER